MGVLDRSMVYGGAGDVAPLTSDGRHPLAWANLRRAGSGLGLLWQRDDELAGDLPLSESSERLGGVLQRVAAVDDRGHVPVFE